MTRTRTTRFNGFKLIELLRQHLPHDFDPEDFLIAGSARLWAGGITHQLSDLDLLVRPGSSTWDRAMELAFEHALVFEHAPLRTSDYNGDKIACLYSGVVEVCQSWPLPDSDTTMLLDAADVIDGLKYLPIPEVIAYKRYLNRAKDRADLADVEQYLRKSNSTLRYSMLLCRNNIDGTNHGAAQPEEVDRAFGEIPIGVLLCGMAFLGAVVWPRLVGSSGIRVGANHTPEHIIERALRISSSPERQLEDAAEELSLLATLAYVKFRRTQAAMICFAVASVLMVIAAVG